MNTVTSDYTQACDKFFRSIDAVSGVESIRSAAGAFGEVLNLFIANRRNGPDRLFSRNYDDFFEACNSVSSGMDELYLPVVQAASSVAGGLSFIRWKTVNDLFADQLYIFDNFVLPLVRMEKSVPDQHFRPDTRIFMYLPNVSPNAVGVANGKSALEMVSQYCAASAGNRSRVALFVGAQGGAGRFVGLGSFGLEQAHPELRSFFYPDFSALISFIRLVKPHAIILDYFTFPWNFLTRLFPQTQFVYRSMGFNCFVARNCTLVIGNNNDSSFRAIIEVMQSRLAPLGLNLGHTTIPRSRLLGRESKSTGVRAVETDKALHALEQARSSPIFGTMCRGTKISQRFASVVEEILLREPSALFFAMGTDVPASRKFFKEVYRNRVFLFDDVYPESTLQRFDVYLETFPEHQGMAVIEALDSGVPVVSLNSDNARHVLLNERLGECVVQSESDYVSLALSLINADKRRALVMRQGAVVDAAYGEPSVIWQKIESFVLETRR